MNNVGNRIWPYSLPAFLLNVKIGMVADQAFEWIHLRYIFQSN